MFSLKICECSEKKRSSLKIKLKSNRAMLDIEPEKDLEFCALCKNPQISKKEARKIIRKAVKKTQIEKGFLIGQDIRNLRAQTGMTLRKFGALLNIHYSKISAVENGYEIQTKAADQVIRMKSQEYITKNHPSRKKLKKILTYLLQQTGNTRVLLNTLMFYIDFWHFKKTHSSITQADYIPLQDAPYPKSFHEIIQEMIDGGELTPIKEHRFKINKEADISEFTKEELATIDDLIALSAHKKGKNIFDLSQEEKGFIETPLYKTIPYEYAKDLKIEELLDEIAETG